MEQVEENWDQEAEKILQRILSKVKSVVHPTDSVERILKAYEFAARYHHGQKRISGEPYILHPLCVTDLLSDVFLDIPSLQCALLHDTVEDTAATLEEIVREFGEEVAFLVDGLTKISRVTFFSHEEKWAENFRKMLLATTKDFRIVVVKLADRLHNLRTLQTLPEEKKKLIATESLDIYAPLAGRLGIYQFKSEMEDLCLKILKPHVYFNLRKLVASKKSERQEKVSRHMQHIQSLIQKQGIPGQVFGRAKNFFSIYKKMTDKHLAFDDIYDLIGIRVIVDTKAQCYETLGLIHEAYRPISGRFKDYIAMPKSNFYQSLHTSVMSTDGDQLEIQIRTNEMNHIAEHGIAAHWAYKEQIAPNQVQNLESTYRWFKEILSHNDLKDPSEYLEAIKTELFEESVFVFSPKGDVYELKKHSSVLDFAFAVHSNLGLRTYGAKKDGNLVSLKTEVQSGNVIEILADNKIRANRNWLSFVKTHKAKSKIQSYLKKFEKEKTLQDGRHRIKSALEKFQIKYEQFKSHKDIEKILKRLKVQNLEVLEMKVGLKQISDQLLQNTFKHFFAPEEEIVPVIKPLNRTKWNQDNLESWITVDGQTQIAIKIAKCCHPLPPIPIVGVVSHAHVIVHSRACPALLAISNTKKVPCSWIEAEESVFPLILFVYAENEPAIIAKLAKKFYNVNIPIQQISLLHENGDRQVCLECHLNTKNNDDALKLMEKIATISGVIKVSKTL